MWYKFTNRFETRHAGLALAVLLSAALSLPANAAEIWKVNFAKSTFSSGSNTLVLERGNRNATGHGVDANGNPTAGSLLVISKGKIFLAMDEATYNASHNGVRTVTYPGMPGMKLVQIGDNVRSKDYCDFRCQSGVPDPRMTVTFIAKVADPREEMSTILAFTK